MRKGREAAGGLLAVLHAGAGFSQLETCLFVLNESQGLSALVRSPC